MSGFLNLYGFMEQLKNYIYIWGAYPLPGGLNLMVVGEILIGLWIGFILFKKILKISRGSFQARAKKRNVKAARAAMKETRREVKKTHKPEKEKQGFFTDLIRDISGYHEEQKKQIPERVLEDIRKSQESSEIYVAGLQLVIIFALGVIYYYTFQGRITFTLFNPLSIAFILYTWFTFVRLMLASFKKLGVVLLMLSIILDFSILGFVIFSLRNYAEEAAYLFYFSFILIALRTLRFQPIWVFLAGLCAFISVSLLAVYMDNIDTAIEVAKLLSILVVTIILMISQFMAKQTSYRAARSQSAVTDLSHFFDHDVVKKIIAQEQAPDLQTAERRTATIMFLDLRGFTLLSRELKASKVINLVKDYQNVVVPVIRKYNGSIDKYMGDGILASFGAVEEQEDFARNALNAVKEILEAHEAWRGRQLRLSAPAPHMGIGLASGEIVYGVIGDETHYEYTVMGDAVNLAAKLEKHTKTQGVPVLCDTHTVELAKEQGAILDMQCFEGVRIEGVPGYKDIWTVEVRKRPSKDTYFT